MPIDAIGHLKPMVSAVEPLSRDPRFAAIKGFARAFAAPAFTGAGIDFENVLADPLPDDPNGDLRWKCFIRPLRDIEPAMRAIRRFRPDVVLYDPFSVYGRIAAAVCRARSAAFVTMHGYGVLSDTFVTANGWERDDVRRANEIYRKAFGTDLRAEGALPALFPSGDATFVTAPASLLRTVDPHRQPLLSRVLQSSAPELPIGSCVDWAGLVPRCEESVERSEDLELLDRLADAKRAGRRIILFSLGTVITDFRYATAVGGAPSGAAFLRRMLEYAFSVVRCDPQLFLVASVGRRYLEGDPLPPPANSLVRSSVPQAEILRRFADVFITHHGANSEAEAILAGVGMVSLPGAGDQISNAFAAISNGVAIANWDLENAFGECTAQSLGKAIRRVSDDASFSRACARLAAEMRAPGEAGVFANALLELAAARSRKPEAEVL